MAPRGLWGTPPVAFRELQVDVAPPLAERRGGCSLKKQTEEIPFYDGLASRKVRV